MSTHGDVVLFSLVHFLPFSCCDIQALFEYDKHSTAFPPLCLNFRTCSCLIMIKSFFQRPGMHTCDNVTLTTDKRHKLYRKHTARGCEPAVFHGKLVCQKQEEIRQGIRKIKRRSLSRIEEWEISYNTTKLLMRCYLWTHFSP